MKNLLFILLLFIPILSFSQKIGRAGGTGGLSIANVDQYLSANRLLSGSDLYNLNFDSLLQMDIHSTEVFITDGPTSFANAIGTTSRYGTENSGLLMINQGLGFDFTWLQEVYNDSIARVSVVPGSASLEVYDRDGVTTNYYSGTMNAKADEVWLRTATPGNITDAEVRVGFGRVLLNGVDSMIFQGLTANESLPLVLAIDTSSSRNRIYWKTVNTGSVSYDTYTSGTVNTTLSRYAGGGTTITNPSAGQYKYTTSVGAHVLEIDFIGNDANLTGGGNLVLIIDNAANSRDRYFSVQIMSGAGSEYDPPGTAYTQTSSANQTTITIPNLASFGVTGYRIMLR